MNREPISYYLKNPSKLVDLSVSQIEKWLQESPFSQPIRTLLAKKLNFNQEIVLDPVIVGAAITASNRTWLYRELHSKVEFKADSSIDVAEAESMENVDALIDLTTSIAEKIVDDKIIVLETLETSKDEVEAKTIEVITADIPEDNNVTDPIVDYEEISSIDALDQNIQDSENKDITNNIEEEILEDQDEVGDDHLDLEKQLKETNEETAIEQLPSIKQEKTTPIKATLDIVTNTPKLIDLNQDKLSVDYKTTAEIQVIRVETDEEFIAGRDGDKKKSKGKKKDKKKIKKDKTKKKKADKKSDEKDKKKKAAKKVKKKAKREKKERNKLQALDVFWEGKEEIELSKRKKEKESKKKSKVKNKKSKIQLLKYDIPVSPSKEEANHYDHDLDEMSNYTQWLLHFSKNKADGSFDHMSTATSKSNADIKDISVSSSEIKKKAKNKGKKKKSTQAKNKSKTDHSLETNEEIISELWADLLAKQGHIKKARKMYLKLSLKYPEKSSYFAAKLENL